MRTKEIVGAILALTFFLGLAPIALADAPGAPFQVGGHVYLDAATVSGADVTVTNLNTSESLTTTTDSNGAYVVPLSNLPSGHSAGNIIQVTATYNGMTGTNSAPRSENLSDSPQIIDVTLRSEDTTAPTIRSVTLNPATVNATGETFTVTVNTTDASGIASVTANATTGTVTLTSTGDDEWAGTLTAPGTAGVYTVTVVATDASPNANNATDTSEQISVIPPSEEQETSYDVNNTATEDNNTVTISDNDTITGTSPLNDTVSIDLGGDYNLVIEINVNSTDNTTGTVASVTLDTPAVTASGTTWEQNESADIDLNLNDSIWTGSNTPKLIIQPLNNIEDKLGDDALENATSAILELHGATTAMVVQATLSGIDESDVKSLPIEMTVDADWYNSQDKVYLFKFDENGVEKQRQLPNSVSHNETSGTYTLSFEMNGFSIFALVGTKTTTTSSHHGGGGGGGSGTYPPGWGTTPAVTATAAHGATPGATHKVTPPAGEAVTKPTTKPAAAEKATPAGAEETSTKKKPGIPGFTAVFAIAGLLAIAYVLMRRRE